jgi:hypothetical protein
MRKQFYDGLQNAWCSKKLSHDRLFYIITWLQTYDVSLTLLWQVEAPLISWIPFSSLPSSYCHSLEISYRALLMSETVIREVKASLTFCGNFSTFAPRLPKECGRFPGSLAETRSVVILILWFALQTFCSLWHLAHWREIHSYPTSEWRSMGPRFDATGRGDENEDRWAWTCKVRAYSIPRIFI